MDVTASMDAPCEASVLFAEIDALDGYPRWMALVHHVEALPDDAGRPAWSVELRARLGPLARSKRLRMVRTVHEPAERHVRFERVETDGRAHASWVLDAGVSSQPEGARLEMRLHYGGALWTAGVMERVLTDQIEAGRERLAALVTDAAP